MLIALQEGLKQWLVRLHRGTAHSQVPPDKHSLAPVMLFSQVLSTAVPQWSGEVWAL